MSAEEATWPPQRRQADQRIAHIETRIGKVEDMLVENTAMTGQLKTTVDEVRDILTTFKTLGTFAKWISSIAAAIVGLWAALKGLRG